MRLFNSRSPINSLALFAGLLIGMATGAGAQNRSIQGSENVGPSTAELGHVERVGVLIEGSVLGVDGAPAPGVLVVSSAGTQASTDAAGCFRLDVSLSPNVDQLQITATGGRGGTMVATQRVSLGSTSTRLRMRPLQLAAPSAISPSWLPTFGGQPGTDSQIKSMAVFDDGSGPALFVGGTFNSAGGVEARGIAKWDGDAWSPCGAGLFFTGGFLAGSVNALQVFDDGSGPALYAGGTFNTAGSVSANRLARWDGTSWSALGSGTDNFVFALGVYDDGNGDALYAGGNFTLAGGVSANRVAKWDGSAWSALGAGVSGGVNTAVEAICGFDSGTGERLYFGGEFTQAGGTPAERIASWDGAGWQTPASAVSAPVHSLTVHDDGNGACLYMGGLFLSVDSQMAPGIAKWDGSSWSSLGMGIVGQVRGLTSFDDGNGPSLVASGLIFSAGGQPIQGIAKWDGSNWSSLGTGVALLAEELVVYDDGTGAALYAGGNLRSAGAFDLNNLAKWDGVDWSPVGKKFSTNKFVLAMSSFDDGSGDSLYVGGEFSTAGGLPASYIAEWDGLRWSTLGSGMNNRVRGLLTYDDGGGEALFACGNFSAAGGIPANGVARWDGSTWTALGAGVGAGLGDVRAMAAHDDGTGMALYVVGKFFTASGVAAKSVARWDGSAWSAVGNGLSATVSALAVFDSGAGPELYAGGPFNSGGGFPIDFIAKWDGTSWVDVGGGTNSSVESLAVYDDGSGPALYAGGAFTQAGAVSANFIAKWDGSQWSALGNGVDNQVHSLLAFDDGNGSLLYAGGAFQNAGSAASRRIASWDGAAWTMLGSGMVDTVSALAVYDDSSGAALYAGGRFGSAADSGDSFIAKWGFPETTPPVLSHPALVQVTDLFANGIGEHVSFTVTATDNLDLAPVVVCTPASGSLFPPGTTWVNCTATDATGNVASSQFPVTVRSRAPLQGIHR